MIINHAWCIEHEHRRDRQEVDNRLGKLAKRLVKRRRTPSSGDGHFPRTADPS
ncbi:hypothetical protein [Kibdelosporangium aridum]|uniref:hypothetical protein n=1 Tax=Kibdelosporangium aridum TaxID=2030 RepID=UPI0035EDCD31